MKGQFTKEKFIFLFYGSKSHRKVLLFLFIQDDNFFEVSQESNNKACLIERKGLQFAALADPKDKISLDMIDDRDPTFHQQPWSTEFANFGPRIWAFRVFWVSSCSMFVESASAKEQSSDLFCDVMQKSIWFIQLIKWKMGKWKTWYYIQIEQRISQKVKKMCPTCHFSLACT